MKLTVKTTQQRVFQIEVDNGETVAVLKAKIHELQGHPVAVQKMIYSGKILTDDKTIDSYGIKEKDFLVLMVSKQMEPTIPAATPFEVTQDTTTLSRSISDPTPSYRGGPGTFLSGDSLQNTINNIVDIGFSGDQVLRAMRASFNNPDRAVEYLTTGFPAQVTDVSLPVVSPVQSPVVTTSPTTNQPQILFQQQLVSSGPGTPQPNLEALRDNPQIQHLREQIVQNPALLQFLIQQLASQNPTVAQILAENPEALLQHLCIDHDNINDTSIFPGAQVVSVTEEEQAVIQRLEVLGFPQQAAAEAYFTCDKNEELAVNYLIESLDNDQ